MAQPPVDPRVAPTVEGAVEGPVERTVPAPLAGVAGAAAVALGAGVGELLAAFVAPGSGPFAAVGGELIDLAPAWAKDTAIALFGTADKAALLIGMGVVMLVLAALAGWLEARRPPWGVVVVLAFGVLGAVVAALRPAAGITAVLPSLAAGCVGAIVLRALMGVRGGMPRAAASAPSAVGSPHAPDRPGPPPQPSRRTFLLWSGAAAVGGVLAAVAAGAARVGTAAVTAVRETLRLPAPAASIPPLPPSADFGIEGLAPVITPNAEFYRIDTALVVPQLDPADWRLRIHGLVEREVTLTWDELLALPLEESVTTLACVSNEVGGSLIGNAVWLGYPIRELLARAQPRADADMVLSRSADGFTASTPLEVLIDDRAAVLAIGMNGDPLPLEHGFPVRMVVPGLYGYVSATKWVVDLEVTRFDRAVAYWTTRGWSERGPIKLQSRIDVPRPGRSVSPGDTVIAGVAWQQHVGITGVEVQIDDGPWQSAQLATAISDDTWVQWRLPWAATAGDHVVRCRAISATGDVQTERRAAPAPDGATGWHERSVRVG